ncbi:hypothetical protein M3650_26930 [Paenibacillus sp. MER TA 81-3]|uniref:hypothetical protein n=1 Tax=Paenibacillus sp. MER TA 81-3 TaxID=2939573 RepID=UPI00203D1BBA|nr:hypothetical protein [Paenibacillus sp. MER TA 81-3]MCM3342156.1 hypothetical protein [Paenibacillus sp. MER TA 81-3]
MKVWRKRTPMYVYRKMIIVFLILVMPIYGISLVFNWTSMNHLRDKAERSLAKNVSSYTNQLNEQISFIRNLQLQLIHNSDLQSLAFYAANLCLERSHLVHHDREPRQHRFIFGAVKREAGGDDILQARIKEQVYL